MFILKFVQWQWNYIKFEFSEAKGWKALYKERETKKNKLHNMLSKGLYQESCVSGNTFFDITVLPFKQSLRAHWNLMNQLAWESI